MSGLALGALSGTAIVFGANELRLIAIEAIPGFDLLMTDPARYLPFILIFSTELFKIVFLFAWPAIVVFVWLPLFAVGILAIRALTPLSRIVAKVQWALKEGDQHPLKAIGCVAAVVLFAAAVGWRTIIGA